LCGNSLSRAPFSMQELEAGRFEGVLGCVDHHFVEGSPGYLPAHGLGEDGGIHVRGFILVETRKAQAVRC